MLVSYNKVIAYFSPEQNNEHLCEMGQSPHQLMFNLYNILALTEIKGYAMIQFSYMMLKLYNKGNFTLEEDLARRSFESQVFADKNRLVLKNWKKT